jgi:hypothetical protein
MTGSTIRIRSDSGRGFTPVRINGSGRDIPHNKDIAVSGDELALLKDSRVAFEVVGDVAPDPDGKSKKARVRKAPAFGRARHSAARAAARKA